VGKTDLAARGDNGSPFQQAISEQIWDMKYRLKTQDGMPVDLDVTDTWRRVAKSLSALEPEWEDEFYRVLESFAFIPAGRINAGAGTDRNVTLFNCFVMGTVPDSLTGIMDALKEAAVTMQAGGGIGYDFSTLRPQGAPVRGVAADASGPLTFMDVWDAMCKTIMSAGVRRGAMMATMRCDHPDIFRFVDAKRDPLRLRNFNVSVLVTDEFMEAVRENRQFDLRFEGKVYKTVSARGLWDHIAQATYAYAEPGVIFIDRINQDNNLNYCETIAATNPCGEQPLPPYGACLLGSINLCAMLNTYGIDRDKLRDTVRVAVRMMDNVVDVSKFPLPAQKAEAEAKRRIGLGVTGVGSALALCGIEYGTQAAQDWLDQVMQAVAVDAYQASIDLAKEKGPFPLFDTDKFLASGNMRKMPEHIREQVREHGIRNALLTSIAPTGTISLYAGNVSSGIEPMFALEYERKVTQRDSTKTTEVVRDYAVDKWRRENGDTPLPDSFVTAQTLRPIDHVRMQAVAQKWVDSSISKTINCPEDISFDDFKDVYTAAWELGCKGCTTYRPNDVTGSVLTATPEPKQDEGAACEMRVDPDTGQLIRTCE
jgi:ribonucleoside-diphosphate reductase alpha chain